MPHQNNDNIVKVVPLQKALELLNCGRTKFLTTHSHNIRQFREGRIMVYYLEDINKISKELNKTTKPKNYQIV